MILIDHGTANMDGLWEEFARCVEWQFNKARKLTISKVLQPMPVEEMFGGQVIRRLFSKLMPGEKCIMHVDPMRATHAGIRHRIHVPIETNEDALFCYEDGTKHHYEVGRAYECHPLEQHWVENFGDTPRIHYLFDYMQLA